MKRKKSTQKKINIPFILYNTDFKFHYILTNNKFSTHVYLELKKSIVFSYLRIYPYCVPHMVCPLSLCLRVEIFPSFGFQACRYPASGKDFHGPGRFISLEIILFLYFPQLFPKRPIFRGCFGLAFRCTQKLEDINKWTISWHLSLAFADLRQWFFSLSKHLQYHISKASILYLSEVCNVNISISYKNTGKTKALSSLANLPIPIPIMATYYLTVLHKRIR